MRAARKHTYYKDAVVCGLNCSTWVCLTEETYSFSMSGYHFNGWPDGRSTMEQEQCVVDIIKIILSELLKDMSDG